MATQTKKKKSAKTTKKSEKATPKPSPTKTENYKRKIIKKCKEVGTYNVSFMITIDILAETLAIRDDAYEKFIKSGGNTVVEHTPDRGEVANLVKNPALVIVRDFSNLALTYLKELGLTAKGLDSLGGIVVEETNTDIFSGLIDDLDI